MTARPVLPLHLAVAWSGVARATADGVAMRSAFGPYVECLAEVVERVTVVAYDPPPPSGRAEDLPDYIARPPRNNIEVLSLGAKGTWRDYWQRRRRVGRIVRRASVGWDVLLVRFGRRAELIWRANICPRVVTLVWGPVRGGDEAALPLYRRGGMALLRMRTHRQLDRMVRDSSLVVTDGEECVSLYGPKARRIVLIRSSSRRARFAFRADDRLVGTAPLFLSVGQVTAEKGIYDTIEAFAQIRERLLPDARLEIVGVGPDLSAARAFVARRGIERSVTFAGWIPSGEDLFSRYRQADVFLFLSRSATESLPRVVSEAMAHSVLVVATTVGSLPTAFTSGTELVLVPIGQPAEAVRAVETLVTDGDLRRRMLTRAYERAKEAALEFVVDDLMREVLIEWPQLAGPTNAGSDRIESRGGTG